MHRAAGRVGERLRDRLHDRRAAGLLEEYTGGKTIEELIKLGYETSRVADSISWEDLREKGYYVVPPDPGWENIPAGLIEFYEDPEKHPLTTPTGKIEFYATGLAEHFPDDEERPPVPKWIPQGRLPRGDPRDRAAARSIRCWS